MKHTGFVLAFHLGIFSRRGKSPKAATKNIQTKIGLNLKQQQLD